MKFFYLFIAIIPIMIPSAFAEPFSVDPEYRIEKVVSGLELPTAMSFIGDDLLVLEQHKGTVRLIHDGILSEEPVLKVNVGDQFESGLLGITTVDSTVYLYFTEVDNENNPIGNRVYKYDWNGSKLVNQVLVTDLPVSGPGQFHNGGALTAGLDGTVYTVIGNTLKQGILQNYPRGEFYDTSVIIKVGMNGVVKPSTTDNPLDHYMAIGVRNSFGLAVDPITGYLWDTENGPTEFDEINLVLPGFNSGFEKIQGPATQKQIDSLPGVEGFKYSDPEFSWELPVAVTGLTFVNSPQFEKYSDTLFVGDFSTGTIYKFKLNSDRTGFVFDNDELSDLVLNKGESPRDIVFATGFEGVIDLIWNSEGHLYVISLGEGTIYKITPSLLDANELMSPKKQSDKGILSKDIVCSESRIQLKKISDETISCVKVTSLEKLLKRQWGSLEGVNLHNKDLSGIDLSGANLQGTILSGANLRDVNLFGAKLNGVILIFSKIINTNLEDTDLSYADLRQSTIDSVNLQNSNLINSKIENSIITDSNFKNANLTHSHMGNISISNSNMINTDLTKSSFWFGTLQNVDLENSIIIKSNFRATSLIDVNFKSAEIFDTSFEGCSGNILCN